MHATHTPGPWEVEGNDIVAVKTIQYIATMNDDGDPDESRIISADARLIAASPELLEALQRTVRWVGKGIADGAFQNCVLPGAAVADLAFAESIIAKATTAPQPASV